MVSVDEIPEEWKEYFDNLEVMVFSGSHGDARAISEEELRRTACLCIEHSHERLVNDASLVAEVRERLSRSPLMPWGTRLVVQGERLPLGAEHHEKDKINELLCLLRGPRSIGMANFWIGIVRHDETPYMAGRLSWLVRHIAGRGKKRKLLFAKDLTPGPSPVAGGGQAMWDQAKVDTFNDLIY